MTKTHKFPLQEARKEAAALQEARERKLKEVKVILKLEKEADTKIINQVPLTCKLLEKIPDQRFQHVRSITSVYHILFTFGQLSKLNYFVQKFVLNACLMNYNLYPVHIT